MEMRVQWGYVVISPTHDISREKENQRAGEDN